MKRPSLFFGMMAAIAVLALVLLSGCQPSDLGIQLDGTRNVIIGTSCEASATKAEIADDLTFSWTPGDRISVWAGSHGDGQYYVSQPYVSGNRFAVELSGVRDNYAVYPASIADDTHATAAGLSVTLPESYDLEGKDNEYSPLLMIAANSEGSDLEFKHIGGLLRLSVLGIPAGTVAIKVDMGHRITGSFQVQNSGAPGESDCRIVTDDATTGRTYVTFTHFAVSDASSVLNLAVPTGAYQVVTVTALDGNNNVLSESTTSLDWTCTRARGKKLTSDGSSFALELSLEHLSYAGGSQTFNIISTKGSGSTVTPAPWKTQVEIDGEWVDLTDANRPVWLPSDFPLSGEGGVQSFTVTPAEQLMSHEERLRTAWTAEIAAATQRPSGYYDKARVDLSKWNPVTHTLENRTTANCYIVQGPGEYMFPMVYGNAIDQICYHTDNNSEAYSPSGGFDLLDEFLTPFQNHVESSFFSTANQIKQPWVSADSNFGSSCTEVGILWQEFNNGRTDVITNVGICTEGQNAHKMITFTVTENISPGNAVIYVKDKRSGRNQIAWSWHIWITDQDMKAIRLKNPSNAAGFPLQPVNLGWIDDSPGQYYADRRDKVRFVIIESADTYADLTLEQTAHEKVSTSGWAPFYQWGRKDPLRINCGFVKDDIHPIYYAIRDPEKLLGYRSSILASDEFDWQDNGFLNLWRAGNTDYSDGDRTATTGTKTVYDPCPRGYVMVPGKTWDGISGTWESGKGWFFNTGFDSPSQVFFPASGYILMENTGSTLRPNFNIRYSGKGTNGYYWTDFPSSRLTSRRSFGMRFSSTSVTASDSQLKRAYALSVRCVRDDRIKNDDDH